MSMNEAWRVYIYVVWILLVIKCSVKHGSLLLVQLVVVPPTQKIKKTKFKKEKIAERIIREPKISSTSYHKPRRCDKKGST